jgi:CBS domain-containing protein
MSHEHDDDELDVLEGDESAPEVGRHHDIGREMLDTPIGDLKRSAAVTVAPTATVARAAELMRKKRIGAVLVKKGKVLVGVFTERDLVVRAMATRGWGSAPVKKFMTPDPETLKLADPVAYALNKMSVGRFRHIPLLDGRGGLAGILSIRDIVDFIVELCPEEILNLPSQPDLAIPHSPDGG